jgi:outer membrane protein OmpA-like peptidoglycan-associated protein
MKTEQRGLNRGLGLTLLLAVVALGPAGCIATQDWVKAQNAQLKFEMDQRLEQVAARVTQLDTRVTQLATQTGTQVTQLNTKVTEARAVADGAVQKAGAVDERLTRAQDNRYKRELMFMSVLHFAPGKSKLLPLHEDKLRGVLKVLTDNPTYTADIVGYADATGDERSNLMLSWLREESARRYLVEHGERGQILNRLRNIGLGEDMTEGDKDHPMVRAADRQVSILIYRSAQ